jgi:prepilin-type N-terminal cleavage/methylation domain-containing protein
MVGNLPPTTWAMWEEPLRPSDRFGERLRRGFTLVELLVVITILLFLISIAVLVVPAAVEGQRASQGAVLLQGWLVQAQQRALLDQAPRGLRLFPDPNNPNFLTRAQFIERPDDFTGLASNSTVQTNSNLSSLSLTLPGNTGVTFTGNPNLDPVQPGDSIEVLGGGTMHRINNISVTTPQQAILTLNSPLPVSISVATPNFRIERAPRLQGDEPMPLPASVGVDINTNQTYNNPLPRNADGSLDILFSPRGEVLGNPGTDKIILWLRDMSQPSEFSGSPTLIVVFTRSGRIGAYPVNPDPNYYPPPYTAQQYPYALVQ